MKKIKQPLNRYKNQSKFKQSGFKILIFAYKIIVYLDKFNIKF